MAIKYLQVNPFSSAKNGVTSYLENVAKLMPKALDVSYISNEDELSIPEFQEKVLEYVSRNFGTGEVIVEAPETRSATLMLDKSFYTHTRLHTPLAMCTTAEGKKVVQGRLSDELRVIHQADVVSSPSYGLIRQLDRYISTSGISVFKNPIVKKIHTKPSHLRKYDVIYMGRFQRLKGTQYINALLRLLPSYFRIALVGSGATSYKLDPRVGAQVDTFEHMDSDDRFKLLSNAKCIMIPSLFENCSMMILESICAHVPVVSWNVGGNSEFSASTVKTVEFDNIPMMSKVIEETVSKGVSDNDFEAEVRKINSDFSSGIESLVDDFKANRKRVYSSSFSSRSKSSFGVLLPKFFQEDYAGKKIFGFTISNEHIEEMWMPIIGALKFRYKFVCRKPLGSKKLFGRQFPINKKCFSEYDWIENPARLFNDIDRFSPDILITHNGSHPMYRHVMEMIRCKYDIPMIYTELGWFPQKNNIYFDRHGVNANSSLSKSQCASLEGEAREEKSKSLVSKDVFIPLQLDNDTNLLVFSPRFRSMLSFLEYVLSQVPNDRRIYIKPHPLDRNAERFDCFRSSRVHVVPEGASVCDLLNSVGIVVGLNSTVLLEALKYPVNIYTGAKGILDNKGLSQSFIDSELSDLIGCDEYASVEKKLEFVRFLEKRQFNVLKGKGELREGKKLPLFLLPIWEALSISDPVKGSVSRGESVGVGRKLCLNINSKECSGSKGSGANNRELDLAIENRKDDIVSGCIEPQQDIRIRSSSLFLIYAGIMSLVLSENQKARMTETPSKFFLGARNPIVKLGKYMFIENKSSGGMFKN